MNLRSCLAILLLTVFVGTAQAAEITVQTYKAVKAKGGADWQLLTAYIAGAGSVLSWASADQTPPLFCPPPNLALDAENFIAMIDSEISRRKLKDTDFIDAYFLDAVKFTFPCKL